MKTTTDNKKRILFICLGNICRSPAAHAVMQHMVDERGLSSQYEDNFRNITSQTTDEKARAKVLRMADFFTEHPHATCVPDPYYGGSADFELALDLIEDGCRGLLTL